MKKFVLTLVAISSVSAFAQIDVEISKIGFYPYVIAGQGVTAQIKDLLTTKIDNIILQNALGDIDNKQFVLLAKVDFVNQTATATIPPVHKVMYSVQLIAADNFLKRKFGVYNINNCVGINRNKERAMVQAMSRVRSDKITVEWLNRMKEEIYSYYKNNCMLVMMEVDALREQKKYDKALQMLTKVPKVTEYCFSLAQSKMVEIYKEKEKVGGIMSDENKETPTLYDGQRVKEDTNIIDALDDTDAHKGDNEEDYNWVINTEGVE